MTVQQRSCVGLRAISLSREFAYVCRAARSHYTYPAFSKSQGKENETDGG